MPEMAARTADVQQRTAMVWSWWKSFAWLLKFFFFKRHHPGAVLTQLFFPPLREGRISNKNKKVLKVILQRG